MALRAIVLSLAPFPLTGLVHDSHTSRSLRMRWLRRVLRRLSDFCVGKRCSQGTPNRERDPEAGGLARDATVGLSTPSPALSPGLLFSRCGSAVHDLRNATRGLS